MRGERPYDVGHAHRVLGVEPPHERLRTTHDADGHPTGHRLAVDDHVGTHAEIFLRPARGEAEARVDLVEDQRHAGLVAHRAQLPQPLTIRKRCVTGLAGAAGEQHGVVGRRRIGMKRLDRIHEHAGDLAPPTADDVERRRIHILQGQAVVHGSLAAEPRLHAVPPAVIGARETDDQLAPGVEARQSRRGHDGLGAAHVKRHLVEPRDRLEPGDVLRDDRMQRAEHEPEILGALETACHPFLVACGAGHVDTVGAAHVERPVTVQMLEPRAVGGGDDGGEVEVLVHEARERKRHPVRVGEA